MEWGIFDAFPIFDTHEARGVVLGMPMVEKAVHAPWGSWCRVYLVLRFLCPFDEELWAPTFVVSLLDTGYIFPPDAPVRLSAAYSLRTESRL